MSDDRERIVSSEHYHLEYPEAVDAPPENARINPERARWKPGSKGVEPRRPVTRNSSATESESSPGLMERFRQAASIVTGRTTSAQSPGSPFGDIDDGLDNHSSLYRRIGGNVRAERVMEHVESIKWSTYLYEKSGPLRVMHDVGAAYVVGDPISVRANDPDVNAIVQEFIRDPANRLVRDPLEWYRRWRVYGEMILPVVVGDMGKCRLVWWDPEDTGAITFKNGNDSAPEWIELRGAAPPLKEKRRESTRGRGHRDNSKDPLARGVPQGNMPNQQQIQDAFLQRKLTAAGASTWKVVRLRDLEDSDRKDMDMMDELAPEGASDVQLLDGNCFWFRTNSIVTARGRPDFMSVFHLADMYDELTFDAVMRQKLLMTYVWVKKWENLTPRQLKEKARDEKMPLAGEIMHLNAKMSLEAISPAFASGEIETVLRFIKGQVGVAGMFSLGFLGEQDTNRASMLSQGEPLLQMFLWKQYEYKRAIESVIQFVIDSAVYHGRVDQWVDRGFEVEMPLVSTKDEISAMNSFATGVGALNGIAEFLPPPVVHVGARNLLIRSGIVTEAEYRSTLKLEMNDDIPIYLPVGMEVEGQDIPPQEPLEEGAEGSAPAAPEEAAAPEAEREAAAYRLPRGSNPTTKPILQKTIQKLDDSVNKLARTVELQEHRARNRPLTMDPHPLEKSSGIDPHTQQMLKQILKAVKG